MGLLRAPRPTVAQAQLSAPPPRPVFGVRWALVAVMLAIPFAAQSAIGARSARRCVSGTFPSAESAPLLPLCSTGLSVCRVIFRISTLFPAPAVACGL